MWISSSSSPSSTSLHAFSTWVLSSLAKPAAHVYVGRFWSSPAPYSFFSKRVGHLTTLALPSRGIKSLRFFCTAFLCSLIFISNCRAMCASNKSPSGLRPSTCQASCAATMATSTKPRALGLHPKEHGRLHRPVSQAFGRSSSAPPGGSPKRATYQSTPLA